MPNSATCPGVYRSTTEHHAKPEWLTLGAEFSHIQRDSNLPAFEYDKNLYLLSATASM